MTTGATGADEAAPLYARIADDLRRQIGSGELPEGGKIPSEAKLAKTWQTSRPTVRQALDVLLADGLIEKKPTIGTFVRRRPAVEVRWSTRYRRRPTGETSPFARDARREGAVPDWSSETDRTRADERVAARLGLAVGDHVMRTRYVYRADGRPIQASVSWEPFTVVGGTPIEEPEGEGRIVGVVARMDSIGVHVDRVTEMVRARRPSGDERRELDIPDGVVVLDVERTHWAGETAVETCDITIPADRYVLAYEIPVPPA